MWLDSRHELIVRTATLAAVAAVAFATRRQQREHPATGGRAPQRRRHSPGFAAPAAAA
jgi:hypothetical protein